MSEHAPFTVRVRWQDQVATVILRGELDIATAAPLSARLAQVVARRPAKLVFDLAGVTFVDCAGLAPLVRARRSLPLDEALVLRSPAPSVRQMLALTGLDQVCVIEDRPPGRPSDALRTPAPGRGQGRSSGLLSSQRALLVLLAWRGVPLSLAAAAWARSRRHTR